MGKKIKKVFKKVTKPFSSLLGGGSGADKAAKQQLALQQQQLQQQQQQLRDQNTDLSLDNVVDVRAGDSAQDSNYTRKKKRGGIAASLGINV